MSGALASYVRGLVAKRILAMILMLTALFQVLDLLDSSTDVLERGLGVRGLLYYAALRLPSEFAVSLPLAVLLGAVFTLQALMKSQEIVAMRAAGFRPGFLLLAMLPLLLPLSVLQLLLVDRVAPVTEARLASWWNASEPEPPQLQEQSPHALWCRTDQGWASIDRISGDARELTGVRIFDTGQGAEAFHRIEAATASWQGDHWQLHAVTELSMDPAQPMRSGRDTSIWRSNLRPEDLLRLQLPESRLSSTVLLGLLHEERVGGRPSSYYRTTLYGTFAAPFSLLVMLLLAMPAMRGEPRGNAVGAPLMLALASGLAFLLANGLLSSLGEGGRIPALLAVALPPLLFGTVALVQWSYLERQ